MKRYLSIIIPFVAAAVMSSCAANEEDIGTRLSRDTFDAWVKKNAPNAVAVGNVYVEYIEHGPAAGKMPVLGHSWVMLNYNARTFKDEVFFTRTDSISKRVGRFAYTTHYSDELIVFTSDNARLCKGLIEGLKSLHVGDSVRIYIPSDQGYASAMSMNEAYTGESATYANLPVIFDVRLKDVISDAYIWERDSVRNYAKINWGLSPDEEIKNTTGNNPERYYGAFLHKLFENPAGDTITSDSSVFVNYAQYYMDGFLLTTNLDTIAAKFNVYNSDVNDYFPLYLICGTPRGDNDIVRHAAMQMKKGEKAQIVSMSQWTYGNEGKPSNTPEIGIYQPTLIFLHVLTDEEKKAIDDAAAGE